MGTVAAASSLLAAGPLGWAGFGLVLAGTALSGYLAYRGMKNAEAQAAEQNKTTSQWRSQDISRESALTKSQLGLQKEQFAFEKKEADRKWKWNEEDRNWQRGWDVSNNIKSLLLSQPKYHEMLQSIWRRQ